LLQKYWKSLGTRIPAGPEALERVPESLARVTETLWLRAIGEARERTKVSSMSKTPSQQALAAMESKVTELTAALADSRARGGEMESQLLTSLRERIELREQVRKLTAMLKAEQELRAQDQGKSNAQGRELQERRDEIRDLARRRLGLTVQMLQKVPF
jgi:chromosome segregation ATPase